MKKYSSSKEIEIIVRTLVRQGWAFHRQGKHGKLRGPGEHGLLAVPCSPSDHRAALNFRRDVRRATGMAERI